MRHTLAALLETVTANDPQVYVVGAPDPLPRFGGTDCHCREAVGLLFVHPTPNGYRVQVKGAHNNTETYEFHGDQECLHLLLTAAVDDFARALNCPKGALVFDGPVRSP